MLNSIDPLILSAQGALTWNVCPRYSTTTLSQPLGSPKSSSWLCKGSFRSFKVVKSNKIGSNSTGSNWCDSVQPGMVALEHNEGAFSLPISSQFGIALLGSFQMDSTFKMRLLVERTTNEDLLND
jgi:hypothetical protein